MCSDVYGFGAGGAQAFDIVFTSYGALCWLPDLARWAQVVASHLAVGGLFYMVEFHPLRDLMAGQRYFGSAAPDIEKKPPTPTTGPAP